MNKLSKLSLLLRSGCRSPSEFRDRLETTWEVRWDRMRKAPSSFRAVSQLEALDVLELSLIHI